MSSFLFKTNNHSKAKKLSPSRYYALAVKNSDPIQYWSGNMPPRMDRKKKNIPIWMPIMNPEPHAWDDNKLVKAAFFYERMATNISIHIIISWQRSVVDIR